MKSQQLIAELDHELVSAAKLLGLVPENKLDWQPHAKAMSLGALANHVASIPGRYLGFAEKGSTTLETLLSHPEPDDKEEILENFKNCTAAAKEFLSRGDAYWESKSWNLTKNGPAVFTLPVPLFIRLLVFNHFIHHRGQLSAYLRTLDIPIPSIYGPSGDENPFG
jgi:uncharacterized damage-inducible protein DinB